MQIRQFLIALLFLALWSCEKEDYRPASSPAEKTAIEAPSGLMDIETEVTETGESTEYNPTDVSPNALAEVPTEEVVPDVPQPPVDAAVGLDLTAEEE